MKTPTNRPTKAPTGASAGASLLANKAIDTAIAAIDTAIADALFVEELRQAHLRQLYALNYWLSEALPEQQVLFLERLYRADGDHRTGESGRV